MKKIKFRPGDTNYRWDFSENSPFTKRSQTVFADDFKLKAKSMKVSKRYYELFFSNEKESYQTRNLHHAIPESLSKDPSFLKESELSGNYLQISFNLGLLLEHLLLKFEENPYALFEEVERLKIICEEEDFTITEIEAFEKVESWDDFMELLRALHTSNGPFKFELMLAAVVQYARLCGG